MFEIIILTMKDKRFEDFILLRDSEKDIARSIVEKTETGPKYPTEEESARLHYHLLMMKRLVNLLKPKYD